jgi:hypothetical protein
MAEHLRLDLKRLPYTLTKQQNLRMQRDNFEAENGPVNSAILRM